MPPEIKSAKRLLICIVLLFGLWFLLHTVLIIWDGLHDEIAPADVAVVLGNQVEADGSPSPRLQARLDKTLDIYQQGLAKKIIVSGGRDANGYEEAEVMQAYLVTKGIPATDILLDPNGYDTYRTAQSARRLMLENKWNSAIIVSHYYHISRARLAFSKFGLQAIYAVHAQAPLELREPHSIAREFIGYYYYLLRDYSIH